MEQNETDNGGERPTANVADEQTPEWHTAGPLLNAPKRLARLVETVLLLSAVTGVLYAWGLSYYHAFSEALGLGRSDFAFQVQPQEALVAGARVLVFFVNDTPALFVSVALVLVVVIAVVALAHFAGILLRQGWRKKYSRLVKSRRGRRYGRRWASLEFSADTERALERIGRAAESYFGFGMFLLMLLVLLRWGDTVATNLGTEAANRQLAACARGEVKYSEAEKAVGDLCGRIGNDYILRVPKDQQPQQGRFILVKESAVKQINIY